MVSWGAFKLIVKENAESLLAPSLCRLLNTLQFLFTFIVEKNGEKVANMEKDSDIPYIFLNQYLWPFHNLVIRLRWSCLMLAMAL